MKFDITQQSVFSTLVTLFVMSIIGMCALLHIDPNGGEAIVSSSLLGGYVNDFQLTHPIISAIVAAILIFWYTVQLGHTVSNINLFGFSTSIHLYMICTILWCSALDIHFLLAAIVAVLAVHVVSSLLRAVQNPNLEHLFNASLALSLLPTLYTPSILLWIFFPFILMLMEITFREAIISMVGLLLPAAAVVYIYWLFGANFIATIEEFCSMFTKPTALFEIEVIPLFRAVIIAIAILLSLLSLFWISGSLQKMQMRLTVVVFIIVSAIMSIFAPSASTLSVALLSPSLAILASFAMANLRGYIANILYFIFWALLLAAIFIPIDLPL